MMMIIIIISIIIIMLRWKVSVGVDRLFIVVCLTINWKFVISSSLHQHNISYQWLWLLEEMLVAFGGDNIVVLGGSLLVCYCRIGKLERCLDGDGYRERERDARFSRERTQFVQFVAAASAAAAAVACVWNLTASENIHKHTSLQTNYQRLATRQLLRHFSLSLSFAGFANGDISVFACRCTRGQTDRAWKTGGGGSHTRLAGLCVISAWEKQCTAMLRLFLYTKWPFCERQDLKRGSSLCRLDWSTNTHSHTQTYIY